MSKNLQINFKLLNNKRVLFDGCKGNNIKTFKGAIIYLLQKEESKQKQKNKARVQITNQRLVGYIMFKGFYPKDVLVVNGKRTFYFDPTSKIDKLIEQYNTNAKRGNE